MNRKVGSLMPAPSFGSLISQQGGTKGGSCLFRMIGPCFSLALSPSLISNYFEKLHNKLSRSVSIMQNGILPLGQVETQGNLIDQNGSFRGRLYTQNEAFLAHLGKEVLVLNTRKQVKKSWIESRSLRCQNRTNSWVYRSSSNFVQKESDLQNRR